MRHNRIATMLPPNHANPAPCGPSPCGFILLPTACMPGMTPQHWLVVQQLYEQARKEAEAVVKPSILERDLLAVWN